MADHDRGARAALITGCSSGIGYDAARTLRARGWRVFASCRKAEDCARLRAEGFESPRIDYQDEASIDAGFAEVTAATGGRLDALFNNGAFASPGAVEDLPTDALRANFEANFFGWHTLTRHAVRVMRAEGAGRIAQCSSILGFVTLKYRGSYQATKFALEGLTDTLRIELEGSGIHVSLIEPGPIRTRIRVNSYPHWRTWIDRETSPHRAVYEKVEARLSAPESGVRDPFELEPSAVSAKLVHAFESPRPRARYYVTTPTYILGFAKRLLPTRMLDRVLIRNSQ